MISENRRARAHIDWPLIAMIAMLAIFGVYAVCVATYAAGGDPDAPLLNQIVGSSYARNQSIFLAVGAVVLIVVMNFPYDWIRRLTVLIYFAATGLVFLVWIFNRAEGVKAWLDIFFGFTKHFQKLKPGFHKLIIFIAKTDCIASSVYCNNDGFAILPAFL